MLINIIIVAIEESMATPDVESSKLTMCFQKIPIRHVLAWPGIMSYQMARRS